MSRPLYVLRHTISGVSPALYSPDKRDRAVRLIERRSDTHVSSETAAFLQISEEDGEPVTYGQLLELILNAQKVVTL
jgi:hypothetical protein